MATTINQVKELAEADTPLLFFECVLPQNGSAPYPPQYWSTHAIVFNGEQYSARVLKHDLFDLQLSADDAMDGITQLSITLANADAQLSQIYTENGFKGSQLTVYFAFADLPTGTITTESTVLFRGVAGDPDEITEEALTLTFTNKLSLQRIPVPEVRIQRSCPWNFPASVEQRSDANNGGVGGALSPYYRCGYSADMAGGVGNLNGGQAYTSCGKTRTDCQARGMFSTDNAGNVTARFGGFEFVPSAITVRTSGAKTTHISPLLDNAAKYNDAVPIIYGQGWLKAPVIFSRNDGNLTHLEVLLGMGPLQMPESVLKVVVNDVEIPLAVAGQDMTTTGWYNLFTMGGRNGAFNSDFVDPNGLPLGDPYGSMAAMSIIVPNRISSGKSLPNVEVLLQGTQVAVYKSDGTYRTRWSDNPAWVILDVLMRCGWSVSDLNVSTFVSAAAFCDELIATTDLNGNPIEIARYKCNLILTKRQSAAVIVRGIRVASSLMLRYGSSGLLELLPETSIDRQQLVLPDGSNSTDTLNNGWPAYEFSDGSDPTLPFSGIVRNANGTSTVRLTSRSIAETSNRLSVEFQDESNEYQQDSLSLVDADDSALIGYEISSQSTALGIANFSHATRVLLRQLDKSTNGNLYIEFQTSFRALKIRPGDIITVTYLRENFSRVPFRVVKLSPSMNYQLVTVTAQFHDDAWYSDNPAVLAGAGRQPGSNVQTPRPLIGLIAHNDPRSGVFEYFDFKVSEQLQFQADGTAIDTLTVAFSLPAKPNANSSNLPLLSLSPTYAAGNGTLPGGTTLYYAVSGLASNGESGLSFTVLASIPEGSNTNSVTLNGLSFPPGVESFNVYRGNTPQTLYQIASAIPIGASSASYTDSGAAVRPAGPPDASFDHANFYWRYENSSAFLATIVSATPPYKIGNEDMGATPSAYIGMAVRIIEGMGRGQERSIIDNDQTTLTINSAWSVTPDATSEFVIAEAAWRFAAVYPASPVQFDVPYRPGTFVQISGRGANVNNEEGDAALCPLTRWPLGQQQGNGGVPPVPNWTLSAPGGGELALSVVGFTDLTNTATISSGTLQIFYWNELTVSNPYLLAAGLDDQASSTTVSLTSIPAQLSCSFIQVGTEIMSIISVEASTNSYQVVRAALGSGLSAHATGDPVLHLEASAATVPFAAGFFSNNASINYIHTISIPDIRVCASEFYVTNSAGDSETNSVCYDAAGGELRTLSGGQFSLQVSGYLATQQNASPPLIIEASHSVRDIRATVTQAAAGYAISVDILQDGTQYCNVIIPDGQTASPVIDGLASRLLPLLEGGTLTMNITLQVDATPPASVNATSLSPGRDLTVTIRL